MFNEPFLINPPGRIFKKGRKKFRKTARKTVRKKMGRKHIKTITRVKTGKGVSQMRRRKRSYRRTRRNPLSDLMLINRPKKARRMRRLSVSGRKGNLRVSRRSRLATPGALINPIIPKMSTIKPVIVSAVGVTAGFVGVRMAMKYVPASWQSGWQSYVAKAGITVVGSYVVGKVTKSAQLKQAVMIGGVVSIIYDLILAYMPSLISSYVPAGMSYRHISSYVPASGASVTPAGVAGDDDYESRI